LAHESLVPPEGAEKLPEVERLDFQTELDVKRALEKLGHEVQLVGLSDELAPLRNAIAWFDPHIVFNLLEEFREQAIYDSHVVGFLELSRAAYTGCNPRGLTLARDKALSKKILTYHRIPVPRFAVFPRYRKTRRPKSLDYPLIVKSLIEEGSYGIAQASLVTNDKELEKRVSFIHETIRTDAVAEQYIDGRELYSAVLGNHRLQVLPAWELNLDQLPEDAPRIATRKVKWDLAYQKKYGIKFGKADIAPELQRRIDRLSRRIARALGVDGYVRIDFRLSAEGQLYFLEANPNPDIADEAEFAGAANAAGRDYPALIQRIVNLGIQRSEKG
jgi:D-alanine-D-alanine ligase